MSGRLMTPKGNKYLDYDIHGEGVDSIRAGFGELGMPHERRDEALRIVRGHVKVLAGGQEKSSRW